jgi:hypothetical protein
MGRKPKEKTEAADNIEGSFDSRTIVLDSGKLAGLKKHLEDQAMVRPEIIKQATITDGHKLNVTWVVNIANGTDTTAKKCAAPIHDDLRLAFSKLNNHLGRLCYQPITELNPEHEKNRDLPALHCPIHCIGFKLSGNEDNESVTLSGSRTLPNAKNIDLQSPPQKWNGDIYDYGHSDELSQIVMECVGEVELYLFDGKHQPDNQLSLFPDEDNEDDTIVE